jgi:hypothetical protein
VVLAVKKFSKTWCMNSHGSTASAPDWPAKIKRRQIKIAQRNFARIQGGGVAIRAHSLVAGHGEKISKIVW